MLQILIGLFNAIYRIMRKISGKYANLYLYVYIYNEENMNT